MGDGFIYHCKKCRSEFRVSLGVGMAFPRVYQNAVADMASGKYGAEWQSLITSQPYMALNGDQRLYKCDHCGHWEVDLCLDVYAPNDPAAIAKKQYGIKTVEDWGHVPYVILCQLREDYHLIKRYEHICPDCKKSMRHVTRKAEFKIISCPECGAPCKGAPMNWD